MRPWHAIFGALLCSAAGGEGIWQLYQHECHHLDTVVFVAWSFFAAGFLIALAIAANGKD